MHSIFTLDANTLEYIKEINETINSKKYWTQFSYDAVLESLDVATTMVCAEYKKATSTTLEETSRRIFENVQGGGIETFINFYNAFLFIRKLQYKIQWHRKYGVFPETKIC